MKKLRGNLLAKTAAVILLTVTAVFLAFNILCVGWLAVEDAYSQSYDKCREEMLEVLAAKEAHNVAWYLQMGYVPEEISTDQNFRFQLYDQNGKLLYDELKGAEVQFSEEYPIGRWFDIKDVDMSWLEVNADRTEVKTGTKTDKADDKPEISTLKAYIPKELKAEDDISFSMNFFDKAYTYRYDMLWYAAGSLVLFILLLVFLMSAAGHRDGSDTITPNFIDRIPFDLFTAGVIVVECLPIAIGSELANGESPIVTMAVVGVCFVAGGLLLLLFLMSFATRLKLRNIIKGCIIYKALSWCWKTFKKLFKLLGEFVHALPMLGRYGFVIAAVLLVEFIYICSTQFEVGAQLFGWFIERVLLVAGLMYVLLCMKRLRDGAAKIAQGDMNYTINTERMKGDLLDHAEDLNNIRDGINKAVNERMKSEHFKTELITNVSHDIKTPLTSIVNYVDLLSRENIENEKAREYIDVLQRQSARLKKLTEDLVEASKASTGNLSVNTERCELGVLLDQTAGEYGEKLDEKGLELILKKPGESVYVMADGRHLWRILDNLMNNICKYAQPGTRVYLDLERKDGKAVMTFRNISKYQLNISGEELTERFVRGDSSRNTEGSGLGLSIASSLARLQGAQLDLTVDGDLFKAALTFDEVK